MTVERWVADVSKYVETQLSEIFNKCVYCSLTLDEPVDTTSTPQIRMFARDITS
jgi:hypothetical protein